MVKLKKRKKSYERSDKSMSGHSKWNNIKQRKGAQDAKRSKIFQKLSKEIYQAAKDGGDDIEMNSGLRAAVDDAKAQNMPKDNIDRAIKRATDPNDDSNYESVLYEGYGKNGVAILVEGLTDNPNRTSADVKHAFSKTGGSMGGKGTVNYMFNAKGYFVISREDLDVDEDTMLMDALEAGAEDVATSDEVFEVYSEPTDFAAVRDALKASGYAFEQAQLVQVPTTRIPIDEETKDALQTLIDMLEDDEDISEVYHNADL